ncbi:hypothetical protein IEQ34_022906 [Dendrobium chrysotoxum]|uniref:Uncharacterized protein n=1 Tax=Dendrobium chrysotoxum TaxID=161865 RepID=A0AAV7FZ63_DENCH|nr:hypothetical protein IEQ34_022906 [Dendrobium chrysotoxum]
MAWTKSRGREHLQLSRKRKTERGGGRLVCEGMNREEAASRPPLLAIRVKLIARGLSVFGSSRQNYVRVRPC